MKMRTLACRLAGATSWIFVGSLVAACGPQDSTGVGNPGLTDDESALLSDGDEANESGDTGSIVAGFPTLSLSKTEHLVSADVAATQSALIGDSRFSPFLPKGCAKSTRVGNVVTTTFDTCVGVSGVNRITGTIVATFSKNPIDGIDIAVESKGLTLALSGMVSPVGVKQVGRATVTVVGTTKFVTWEGSLTTTSRRSLLVQTTASYRWSHDDADDCVALQGTSTGTVGTRTLSTTVENYRRCGSKAKCPQSGTITIRESPSGASLVVEHLGLGRVRIYVGSRIVETELKRCAP